ncbi:uncharacterized protein DS421_6g188350 [Arachis hypogaea]|nr:uncharacterized protein DS421_6g188350 [Arachis hypogaea]
MEQRLRRLPPAATTPSPGNQRHIGVSWWQKRRWLGTVLPLLLYATQRLATINRNREVMAAAGLVDDSGGKETGDDEDGTDSGSGTALLAASSSLARPCSVCASNSGRSVRTSALAHGGATGRAPRVNGPRSPPSLSRGFSPLGSLDSDDSSATARLSNRVVAARIRSFFPSSSATQPLSLCSVFIPFFHGREKGKSCADAALGGKRG